MRYKVQKSFMSNKGVDKPTHTNLRIIISKEEGYTLYNEIKGSDINELLEYYEKKNPPIPKISNIRESLTRKLNNLLL